MSFIDAVSYHPIGKLRYAVRCWGPREGEPMLLLHGLRDNGASFAPLAAQLEALQPGRFLFIAPDWRGHGDSEYLGASYWFPEYLADLDALIARFVGDHGDVRPVILVGHSMGGQVASQYAGVRPRQVSHLITLDSLNVPDRAPHDAPRRYRRWLDAQRNPPSPRHHATIDTIVRRIGRHYPELDDPLRRFLAEHWSQPTDDDKRCLRVDPWHQVPFPYGFRADESMALWREVTAAVLCMEAGDSPLTQFMREELAIRRACFGNLCHMQIPDCGHMLHLQRPAAVAQAMIDFL